VTVHLISVGRSVLNSLEKPDDQLANRGLATAIRHSGAHELIPAGGDAGEQARAASDWVAAALGPGDGAAGSAEPPTGPAARLAEAAARVRPAIWPCRFSAELETFGKVLRGACRLPDHDIAILICSDTSPGLLAAVWNALALTGGDFSRVRYQADLNPGQRLARLRNHVVLIRVPHLDARSAEDFREAMGYLGRLARRLFESGELTTAEPFDFYLSGGYKATIPYLIGMAEAVRSVDRVSLRALGAEHLMPDEGTYPAGAFVLHETARDDPGPIPLPLRLLDMEAVRSELRDFDAAGHRPGIPSSTLLNGYAYEITKRKDRETCTLTAFGAGLRAFLGVGPEGFPR